MILKYIFEEILLEIIFSQDDMHVLYFQKALGTRM